MRKIWSVLVLGFLISSCSPPNISSLDPNAGPPRTVVSVTGGTFTSTLLWDAGSGTETSLTGGFLGASLFSVPAGASVGNHTVQLIRKGTRGNTRTFNVTAATPWTSPRTDRISLLFSSFTAGNKVNSWMYVQGANADVDAEVLVDNVVVPTVAHRAMQNNLLGIAPEDLNLPIYHHIAFLIWPGELNCGQTIQVKIRNSNGQTSAVRQYTMPMSAATLDSDGDDIPDEWEKNGYDADGDGTVDIDLPGMGADPLRPDIFLEVDVMNGLAHSPTNTVWNGCSTMFENAPIINPHGVHGVNLHIDHSGTVPHHQLVSMTDADNAALGRANFYTLKSANFNNAVRGRIYQYCIWADMQPGGYSGISDPKLNASQTDFIGPGDDFLVTFDDFPNSYQTDRSGIETLVHELGHNLLQRHGGSDHFSKNPTYNSVMSYSWQLRTGHDNATRRSRPVYTPLYYGQNGVVEVNGALPAAPGNIVDYSSGMGRSLVESSLDETAGLFNGNRIDWNQDGDTNDANTSRDINGDGDTNDTWRDYANWFKLSYSGPRQNGGHGD